MRSAEYGYRILPRTEFMALDRLEGFKVEDYSKVGFTEEEGADLDRANAELLKKRASQYTGAFVLFDPYSDDDGFMLVGDDANELDRICFEHEQEIRDA